MRKHRRLLLDLVALAWFAAWIGLLASVVTFDPADPPAPQAYPVHSQAKNLLGEPGAWVASWSMRGLGLAVYPALVTGFVLVLTLLLEGRRGSWLWRLIGWQLLVPGVALAADWLAGIFPSLAAAGAGGYLGATLHDLLQGSLTTTGMLLVLGAALAGGLGLAGDFLWPTVGRLLRTALARWRQRKPQVQTTFPIENTMAPEVQDPESFAMIPVRRQDFLPQPPPKPVMPREPVKKKVVPRSEPAAAPLPINRGTAPTRVDKVDNDYELPPFELLEDPKPFDQASQDEILRDRAVKLEKVCQDFNVNVRVVGINTGPVVTQYELALETGLRVNKVTSLSEDLALNLKVPSVRIVAPLPGRDTVGVEIPNEHRAEVKLKEVLLSASKQVAEMKIPLFLGKDAEGQPLVQDLADMPHLLIAGRTGTGKSVCMNAIIVSILMTRRPDQVKMIMIDPKMLEMNEYSRMPHLMHPVVKDMKKAEAILAWAVDKMEERYDLLSRARVRNIASYNQLTPEEIYRRVQPEEEEKDRIPEQMPYIVIFVDEMADLMMQMRKEVEGHIIRLAQKSRAAGIHLIVATQKPTVDVITGLIKSNLPARVCFQVASRTDSRVVLDEMGAEKLLGRGDMLYLQPNTSTIIRAQGTYLRDQEIAKIVDHMECDPEFAPELMQLSTRGEKRDRQSLAERDTLYEDAIEIIVREQRGSVSLLQRALGVGYGRAARLIDFMAEDGYVGPYNGQSAREVLLTPEEWAKIKGADSAPEAA